jgi:hypothetical protein
VYQQDDKYHAKNVNTGSIEYSDANAGKVIQYAIDETIKTGGGGILIRRGIYNAYSQVWIRSTIGRPVTLIIKGEGGATGIAEESATRIVFRNLPLTNENTSTAIRVGYRYDDDGNEVSNWPRNGVKVKIEDLSIHCYDTRYRGLVIEGASDRFDLINVGIYNCAYGLVLRGMTEAGIGGRIVGCNISGGYRDVRSISGAAMQIGDIVNNKVIVNGIANLLIENTGLLNIGYPPQNPTLTSGDLESLRPAALRLINGGRITVMNSHLHLGGWRWGYGLHLWGSQQSNTQPITTASPPYPGGDIEIYGTNFEGSAPINPDGSPANNIDNVFVLQETDTGWIIINESYFYGNGGIRMLLFSRRGRVRISNSRVFHLYGSVELATYYSKRMLAAGGGHINDTEVFYIENTIPCASEYILYNGESCEAQFTDWSGSRRNPAILPTNSILLWGNTMYYKLPAGTNVNAGINIYNAHHAYASIADRLPNFEIQILQSTPELIFVGATIDTSLPGFKLMFYAPQSATTSNDVIVKIKYK